MHTRRQSPTRPKRRDRQAWCSRTWSIAAVIALALVVSSLAHARTFQCGAGDADCLITAINEANANGQTNTIRLAAGIYTLTEVDNTTDGPNGLPSITSTLTITGAGANTTIIQRQANTPFLRLLYVASTGNLTLTGVTLQGGILATSPKGHGGGIANLGTLTLTDVILTDNTAINGGGGLYNGPGGTGTLTKCMLAHNNGAFAPGSHAGGILNDVAGTLTLINSTVAYNAAIDSFAAGILNSGILMLTNSTVAHNTASFGAGGGILNSGALTLTNSTVAYNEANGFPGFGGGIVNSGTLALTNSTVAYNTATFDGGGLLGSATLQNTILALNTSEVDDSPDCSGVVTSLGNNLFGNLSGCTITLQSSDVDLEGNHDPALGDFTDNGPPGTGYVPLLPTSPAIDAGNDATCPRADQLGQRRVDIPGVGTSRCDIGAIEFQRRDNRPSTVAQVTP